MGCVIAVIAFFIPRTTLFFIWLLTDWLKRAFDTTIWPLLGFFFFPYSTLSYMAAMLNDGRLSGAWLALFILAFFVDFCKLFSFEESGKSED
jgi:hypothetical protein